MTLSMILVVAAVLAGAWLVCYHLGRVMGLTLLAALDAEPDRPAPQPARPARLGRLSRPAFRSQPQAPAAAG